VTPTRPAVLALIPARGGSKSIPRKNLLRLAGKPLIAHTIAVAQASTRITRIVVSTDDEEIAEVARACGAEVPFLRPAEFAQDHSPDIDAFRHALLSLRDLDGYRCDAVVHLRPTNPVREPARVDQAIAAFLASPRADSLRSVSPAAQTPYKMWRVTGGLLEPVVRLASGESFNLPRQGLPQVFWQNGYVDIVRPEVILERGQMSGDRILPFVMDEPIYELDYPDGIAAAEAALLGRPRAAAAGGERHVV
jgi:N-acylneuraminate cytidylyltransferase